MPMTGVSQHRNTPESRQESGRPRELLCDICLEFFQGRKVDARVCRQRTVEGGDLIPA